MSPLRVTSWTTIALGVAVAAGCSSAEPEALATTYYCGAQALDVTATGDTLTINVRDQEHQLRSIESASGARYVNDDEEHQVSFWSRGQRAQFEVNGQTYPECRQAGAIIEPLVARGNEPFWTVTIADDEIILHRMGEDEVAYHIDERTHETTQTKLRNSDASLTLIVEERLCQDSMSGMYFPQSAELTLDDETLQGCAGNSMELLQGVTWQVSALDEHDYSMFDVNLRFTHDERQQVVGRAACNRYFGDYELSGESLHVGQIAGTKMACEDEAMRVEYEFLSALSDVQGFSAERGEGGELALRLHTEAGTLHLEQHTQD